MAQVRKSSVKNVGVNVPIYYYTPRGKIINYNNTNYKDNNINNYIYITQQRENAMHAAYG